MYELRARGNGVWERTGGAKWVLIYGHTVSSIASHAVLPTMRTFVLDKAYLSRELFDNCHIQDEMRQQLTSDDPLSLLFENTDQ